MILVNLHVVMAEVCALLSDLLVVYQVCMFLTQGQSQQEWKP